MQASGSSQAAPIEADAAEIAHATAEGQQQHQHVKSDDAAQHQDGHAAVFGAEELSGERHGSHAEAGPSEQQQQQGPASFVITHSVAKRHNVGTIARCATAFGVKQVCALPLRAVRGTARQ